MTEGTGSKNNLISALATAQQEIAKLSALIDASQTINSALELDVVLDRILLTATENVRADRGTIYLVDEPNGEIWSKVLQGEEKLEIRLPLGQGLAGYVARTGEVIILDDAYSDPRFNSEVDKASGYKTESMITTPMRNKEGDIIGVFQLLNKTDGLFSQDDVAFLDALSAHAAIALENAFLLKESLEKKELEKELDVAEGIQKGLLPADSPEIEGFELLGVCTPCDAVGGDSYDYILLDDGRWLITIADVVGHGVPAAMLMANLYATLRSHSQYDFELTSMVARVNDFIHRSTDTSQFITMFCGILDPASGEFTFTNAGHNPPYLVRANADPDETVVPMTEGGIPLGMMPSVPYSSGNVTMDKGDILFLFTDGVSEVMNEEGELMGEEALEECLKQSVGLPLASVIHEVQMEVRSHAGDTPYEDDVTMVGVQRLP
ncbi:MAG: SpoIIE family protein phosphatase [Candidatus Latescibacteria bacterium]|nr:SpoIIE family protein phosphatase [Candidatus Latescibacterota bacterium]